MTATASYDGVVFPGVGAPVREDGTSAFTPQLSFTESGTTVTVDAAFNINSLRVGELTGTLNEVWRVSGVTGEARLLQTIFCDDAHPHPHDGAEREQERRSV